MIQNKKGKSSILDDVGFAAVKGTSILRLGRKKEKITPIFALFLLLSHSFFCALFIHLPANSTKTLPSIMS